MLEYIIGRWRRCPSTYMHHITEQSSSATLGHAHCDAWGRRHTRTNMVRLNASKFYGSLRQSHGPAMGIACDCISHADILSMCSMHSCVHHVLCCVGLSHSLIYDGSCETLRATWWAKTELAPYINLSLDQLQFDGLYWYSH